jgi:hypothetical protein
MFHSSFAWYSGVSADFGQTGWAWSHPIARRPPPADALSAPVRKRGLVVASAVAGINDNVARRAPADCSSLESHHPLLVIAFLWVAIGGDRSASQNRPIFADSAESRQFA